MIDIARADAHQSTINGVTGDWIVKLDGKELYTLPANFTSTDTFLVRGIIEKMLTQASDDVHAECSARIEKIVEHGNRQLDVLKAENERLATALEQHILTEEAV